MEYQNEIAGGFVKWFPSMELGGKEVFDIGCGYGGRAVRFAELGAKRVVALEPFERHCTEGAAFAVLKGVSTVQFVLGTGEQIPLADNSFDVVTSYDVFEHVEDLGKVLQECARILKPGGTLYAVFPPFFHPTGSHLESWVSRMPWANVLFRRGTLVKAVEEILKERDDGYTPQPMRPRDALWTLNGATIGSVRRLLTDGLFSKVDLELYPLFSRMNSKWDSWRMKYYAFAFRPLRRVPRLNELFVHRIVLSATK
jgi:SAM-dependent methyltransferase